MLCLNSPDPSPLRTLSRAKHEGLLGDIPRLAQCALAALNPVPPQVLLDRLTMLGMSMIRGMTDPERKAWLHETGRLLSDLPEAIVLEAIDECVKEPGRAFAPTVGEIRAKALPPLEQAKVLSANLQNLARLVADGVEIPDYQEPRRLPLPEEPKEVWRPEPGETAAILAEVGLRGTAMGDKLAAMVEPSGPSKLAA